MVLFGDCSSSVLQQIRGTCELYNTNGNIDRDKRASWKPLAVPWSLDEDEAAVGAQVRAGHSSMRR